MNFAQSVIPAGYEHGWFTALFPTYSLSVNEDGTATFRYPAEHFDEVEGLIADYPQRHLDEVLKVQLWAQIKAIRARLENSPAPTPIGHPIDTDAESKSKILGVALTAALGLIDELVAASIAQRPFDPGNLTFAEQFTMADNHVATLNTFTAIACAKAAGGHVSLIYAHARGLREQIAAATTAAELEAIDLETGWPA